MPLYQCASMCVGLKMPTPEVKSSIRKQRNALHSQKGDSNMEVRVFTCPAHMLSLHRPICAPLSCDSTDDNYKTVSSSVTSERSGVFACHRFESKQQDYLTPLCVLLPSLSAYIHTQTHINTLTDCSGMISTRQNTATPYIKTIEPLAPAHENPNGAY